MYDPRACREVAKVISTVTLRPLDKFEDREKSLRPLDKLEDRVGISANKDYRLSYNTLSTQ